jgi:hypothetical protein
MSPTIEPSDDEPRDLECIAYSIEQVIMILRDEVLPHLAAIGTGESQAASTGLRAAALAAIHDARVALELASEDLAEAECGRTSSAPTPKL